MKSIDDQVTIIMDEFNPQDYEKTAIKLQNFWNTLHKNKGINLIKVEQRAEIGASGVAVPDLKLIGNKIAESARIKIDDYLDFAVLLWEKYGREGRIVASIVFGAMELVQPQKIVPILKTLCRKCVSWEDADRIAMDAVEPILREYPDTWIDELEAWLADDNKWVRRAAITALGRLPMKKPDYLTICLEDAERMLGDPDPEVQKAVSFAIRLCAKTDTRPVFMLLEKHIPTADPNGAWVLCDVIKSMDKKKLVEFSGLYKHFMDWCQQSDLNARDKKTIKSAAELLKP